MSSPETFKLYRYSPSTAAAGVATALFAIVTALHGFKMYRSRGWFLIPLFVGGLFEIIGYAARAYSASQTPNWTLGPYILQSLLLLVAPVLFAGSIYMILGRIILMTDGESHAIVRRKWLTKVFVACDVLAFVVQSGGASLQASHSIATMNTGEKIAVTGLFIQIIAFSLFVAVAVVFHARMVKVPTSRSSEVPWKKHLLALYISSGLIMVRSIFRVIEFIQGNAGYVFTHEWFLYVFDALLMLGVLGLFCWVHPGEIRGYLERKGNSQEEDSVPMQVHQRLGSDVN
ncbi:Protein RTM1 [Lachnellula suecica]|uniref:Protein RTM1 n=1 Tax=Lachnellula suecica TaxID=602035 RepID=A0A8T9C122_9HELO|nr:Protein RTM1 [Lachnellula suecica]